MAQILASVAQQHASTIAIVAVGTVIALIAFDLLDVAVAGLIGVSALVLLGVLSGRDLAPIIEEAGPTLALLFGGMVVARTLVPTGLFDRMSGELFRLSRGEGRRFLLGIAMLAAPLSAILPNATVVILLAPVIIGTSRKLAIDFVAPMILLVLVSNTAGLLTLVADPATFYVGSARGISFGEYLARFTPYAILALIIVVAILPWLVGEIWRTRRSIDPDGAIPEPLRRPGLALFSLGSLALMVLLFIFGDSLPAPLSPPAAAIVGATCALLVTYHFKVEHVTDVLMDIDWRTLVFFACMFALVHGLTESGALNGLYRAMESWFGSNLLLASLCLLIGTAIASALLPNVPLIAALALMVKGYLVLAGAVPEEATGTRFVDWPASTLPIFGALAMAATLGGSLTPISSAANLAAVAICGREGERVGFGRFMRLAIPIVLIQVAVATLYLTLLSSL